MPPSRCGGRTAATRNARAHVLWCRRLGTGGRRRGGPAVEVSEGVGPGLAACRHEDVGADGALPLVWCLRACRWRLWRAASTQAWACCAWVRHAGWSGVCGVVSAAAVGTILQ